MSHNPQKIEFINSKIMGIKARMLKDEELKTLALLESIEEVIERLEKTQYKEVIEENSLYMRGGKLVEFSCYKWVVGVINKISKYFTKNQLSVSNLFLKRHEIKNLKLLISSKVSGKSWEEVEPLLFPLMSPSYYLNLFKSDYSKMLQKTEIGREISKIKTSELWRGKEQIMEKLLRSGEMPLFLILSLELYYGVYLENLSKSNLSGKPLQILRKEQDIKNLNLLFYFKEKGKALEEFLNSTFRGGLLKEEELARAWKNEDYLERILRKYKTSISSEMPGLEMKLGLIKEKREFNYPIGFEKVLAFFLFLESEAELISYIARGKEIGLDKETILRVLPS